MPEQNSPTRYALLAHFLPLLAEFEASVPAAASNPADALNAFLAWLPTRTEGAALPAAVGYPGARIAPNQHESPESLLSKLVTFLYRYVRSYTRLALADTPLVTFDDFTYLIMLFADGPFSKSELIARNIQEKATGTEIIKRLLERKLVSEGPHATDRRRKVLHLTPAGQALLFRILPRMEQVAHLGAGNLSPAERHQLVHLLHKLDAFHHPIFAAPKPDDFEAFIKNHLPKT